MILLSFAIAAGAQPVIPVGLDAYRMWDRWPYQRIGVMLRRKLDYAFPNQRVEV